MASQLLRVNEVAETLGIGRTTLYGLFKAGELRSVRVGGSRRVPRSALEEYLARIERDGRESHSLSGGAA